MKSRKEIKNLYKEKKFTIGVFQIRNKVNNKVFIDSGLDLDALWNRNKFQLNGGTHLNKGLQKEWKEFGADQFQFEILSEIKQDDEGRPRNYRKEARLLATKFIEALQSTGQKDIIKDDSVLRIQSCNFFR
jgi:hypothetical protein